MPRHKTQPVEVVPGGEYGTAQGIEASQAQVGLPDRAAMSEDALHRAAVGAATETPAPPPGGLFGMDNTRPGEPFTAGLDRGPGPGSEALTGMTMRQDRVQQQLELAAEISGNPTLAEMAGRTRRPVGRKLPSGGGYQP